MNTFKKALLLCAFIPLTSCGSNNNNDIKVDLEPLSFTAISVSIKENETFEFRCNDTSDLQVIWGDETTNSEKTHEYSEEGNYTIVITGNVTTISVSDENGVYQNGNAEISSVFLSNTITTIPEHGFNVNSLSSVFIPSRVTTIGKHAFHSIHSISFKISAESKPSGWDDTWSHVATLKDYADWGLKIGYYGNFVYAMDNIAGSNYATAMMYSNSETEVTVPDVVSFENKTYQITSLSMSDPIVTTVHMPKYIRVLQETFVNCTALKTIDYSKCIQLEYIGDESFRDCTALKEFVVPKTVKHIVNGAVIRGCPDNMTLKVEDGNKVFTVPEDSNVIMENGTKLVMGRNNSTIPNDTKIIGDCAFHSCNMAGEIDFPDSVEVLGNHSFYENKQIDKVILPAGLKKLGFAVFAYCTLSTVDASKLTNPDLIPHCDFSTFLNYDYNVRTFYYNKDVFGEQEEPTQFISKGWPSKNQQVYSGVKWEGVSIQQEATI